MLCIEPKNARAHRLQTLARRYSKGDPHIGILEGMYAEVEPKSHDRLLLGFALSKVYEDLGLLQKSFVCLQEAKKIQSSRVRHEIVQDREIFDRIKKIYLSPHKIKKGRFSDAEHVVPIFILGMPRSGTTLVEQILSAHKSVLGGGEFSYIGSCHAKFMFGGKPLNVETLKQFREFYLTRIQQLSEAKNLFTDKMPSNFRDIRFYMRSYPEAKIIHVHRDPAAHVGPFIKASSVMTL